ncbi:GDP-mannose 4,6-dehydratase [Vibrio bathopelagicus]|uniref:GDP-mannose 4,6-dehydratase n=1 Tax=Vibrio bathopelagicus TaxID=2777577 RepID=UPI001CF4F0F7
MLRVLVLVRYTTLKYIRFIHISTDEVFGDLADHELPLNEHSPYKPSSSCSPSKASSESLAPNIRPADYHHQMLKQLWCTPVS